MCVCEREREREIERDSQGLSPVKATTWQDGEKPNLSTKNGAIGPSTEGEGTASPNLAAKSYPGAQA